MLIHLAKDAKKNIKPTYLILMLSTEFSLYINVALRLNILLLSQFVANRHLK